MKAALAGLAGLGLGVAIYILSDDGKKKVTESIKPLEVQQLLEILQDLKNETIMPFIGVSSFAATLKQQTDG